MQNIGICDTNTTKQNKKVPKTDANDTQQKFLQKDKKSKKKKTGEEIMVECLYKL